MGPLIQKRIIFENKDNVDVNYEDLEKAMLWYVDRPLMRHRKIYMHGKYYAVSLFYKKIHIHRLLKMWEQKKILKREEHVHHKDENILNNNLSNLEIIHNTKHASLHLKGKSQNKEFSIRRTNASCLSRYGHETKEYKKNKDYLNLKKNKGEL